MSDLDFHHETGRVSLDLIATLGDRFGEALERLKDPKALAAWLNDVAGRRFHDPLGDEDLAKSLRLRDSLCRVFDALYAGDVPAKTDIETVNRFAAQQPAVPLLLPDGRTLASSGNLKLDDVLGEIARDAIDLLTGDEFAKTKRCAAEDCSVLFVDRSRPGKRRWCSMSRCGNREKKRGYNARARQSI